MRKGYILKKYYFSFIAVITLITSVFAAPVFADIKIGFVNSIKIMEKAPQVEAATRRLEREFDSKKNKIVNFAKEVKAMEDRWNKNADIMDTEDARELGRKVREKQRELQALRDDFNYDYNFRRSEELDKLQKLVVKVIQKIAEDNDYDLVLSEGVVWASKKIDITDTVLDRLRKEK
jgi:outer membrane protein